MMTGREVVRIAFEGGKPPRIAAALIAGGEWYVHLSGRTFAQIKQDPQAIADIFLNAYSRVGQDMLWTGAGLLNYPTHALGCPIQDDTSDSPALLGSVIQSYDQLDVLSIQRVLQNPIMQAIAGSHHLVADAIGKETMILPTLWGPFTTASRIIGTEAHMIGTVQNPTELLQLIQFTAELIWAIAEPTLDHPDIPGINLSEPVASGDMISPATFRTFVSPFLKELVNRAHRRGKYCMLHICGDTTPLLEDVLDIGPDCFSLESKVDLERAAAILGGRVCVAGNVSPTGALLNGTPEDVVIEAKACVARWGEGGGFILAPGCDFPKRVPLENIEALMSLKGLPM
jgi:uroporphyrinogen decarboxylase